MDSYSRFDQLRPWTGEAEALFCAAEAAIEAATITPLYVSIQMQWEDTKWDKAAADSTTLTDARSRIRHGPPPNSVTVSVAYDESGYGMSGLQTEVGIYVSTGHQSINLAGRGTDALRARRAYEAAHAALVAEALVRSSSAPADPVLTDLAANESPIAITSRGATHGPFGWIESHPVATSIVCTLILSAGAAIAKLL